MTLLLMAWAFRRGIICEKQRSAKELKEIHDRMQNVIKEHNEIKAEAVALGLIKDDRFKRIK